MEVATRLSYLRTAMFEVNKLGQVTCEEDQFGVMLGAFPEAAASNFCLEAREVNASVRILRKVCHELFFQIWWMCETCEIELLSMQGAIS